MANKSVTQAVKDVVKEVVQAPKQSDSVEVTIVALMNNRQLHSRPGGKYKKVVLNKHDAHVGTVEELRQYIQPNGKGEWKIKNHLQTQFKVSG